MAEIKQLLRVDMIYFHLYKLGSQKKVIFLMAVTFPKKYLFFLMVSALPPS